MNEFVAAFVFVLLPFMPIMFGIYKLISKAIDKKKGKDTHQEAPAIPKPAPQSPPKPKEPEPAVKIEKRIIEPASSCPSCGGHLTGTSDNCPYCNAAIPQNILYNKELMLELKEKEMALRAKELEHKTREKELNIKNEQDARKQESKPIMMMFGVGLVGLLILFIMWLVGK